MENFSRDSLEQQSGELLDDICSIILNRGAALKSLNPFDEVAPAEALRNSWEGYHLLEFASDIKLRVNEVKLEEILKAKGIEKGFQYIQTAPANTYKKGVPLKIFEALAEAQGIRLLRCLLMFLEFCAGKSDDGAQRKFFLFDNDKGELSREIKRIRKELIKPSKNNTQPYKYLLIGVLVFAITIASAFIYLYIIQAEKSVRPELVLEKFSYDDLVLHRQIEIETQKENLYQPSQLSEQYADLARSMFHTSSGETLETIQLALDLDPKSSRVHAEAAWVHFEHGNMERFESHFKSAKLLANNDDYLTLSRVKVLEILSLMKNENGAEEATKLAYDAVRYAELAKNEESIIFSTFVLSLTLVFQDDIDRARKLIGSLPSDCATLGNIRLRGTCFELLSAFEYEAEDGNMEQALEFRKKSIEAYEKAGDKVRAIQVRSNMSGHILKTQGWEAAEKLSLENLDEAEKYGYVKGQIASLVDLSHLYEKGALSIEKSVSSIERAVELVQTLSDPVLQADLLRKAARLTHNANNYKGAWKYNEEGLALAIELGQDIHILNGALNLYSLASVNDDSENQEKYFKLSLKKIGEVEFGMWEQFHIFAYPSALEHADTEQKIAFWEALQDGPADSLAKSSAYRELAALENDPQKVKDYLEMYVKSTGNNETRKIRAYLTSIYSSIRVSEIELAFEYAGKAAKLQEEYLGRRNLELRAAVQHLANRWGFAPLIRASMDDLEPVFTKIDSLEDHEEREHLLIAAHFLSVGARLLKEHDKAVHYARKQYEIDGDDESYSLVLRDIIKYEDNPKQIAEYMDILRKHHAILGTECEFCATEIAVPEI